MKPLYRALAALLPAPRQSYEGFGKGAVWFHAASIGESLAALPVVKLLEQRGVGSCFTVNTKTAVQSLQRRGQRALFFPGDSTGGLARLFGAGPSLLVVCEAEIWPNLLFTARERAIPVVGINSRMSERSLKWYSLFGSLFRPAAQSYTRVLAKRAVDGERFVSLGVPPERVEVAGDLKYDAPPPADPPTNEQPGLPRGPLFVFGSIREGEYRPVAQAAALLTAEGVGVVVAPRHIGRAGPLLRGLQSRGLKVSLRSKKGRAEPLLVLDTAGELAHYYARANAAFVGGTLSGDGGHNLVEPAACGLPVLFGPYTQNVEETAEGLLGVGGGFRVRDGVELAQRALSLIRDEGRRQKAGDAARSFVESKRGAAGRAARVILSLL